MEPRSLRFSSVDEVIAEVDRLQAGGYTPTGRWDLPQMCEHLAYYVRGSLDGFGFRLPWPVRVLLGRPLRRRLLEGGGQMKRGMRTIPASVPAVGSVGNEAVTRFRDLLVRFRDHDGPLPPSPLLGPLTKAEWQTLHLGHCAHHLGFLVPRSP